MLDILEDIKIRKEQRRSSGELEQADEQKKYLISKDSALMGFFQLANYLLTIPFLALSFFIMDKFVDYFFAVILGLVIFSFTADLIRIQMSKSNQRVQAD
jgi:hypothetical protein